MNRDPEFRLHSSAVSNASFEAETILRGIDRDIGLILESGYDFGAEYMVGVKIISISTPSDPWKAASSRDRLVAEYAARLIAGLVNLRAARFCLTSGVVEPPIMNDKAAVYMLRQQIGPRFVDERCARVAAFYGQDLFNAVAVEYARIITSGGLDDNQDYIGALAEIDMLSVVSDDENERVALLSEAASVVNMATCSSCHAPSACGAASVRRCQRCWCEYIKQED